MEITFKAIGIIHTPFLEDVGVPIQSARSVAAGAVELFPEYRLGLEGVEEFSHLILLYVLHRSSAEVQLKVKPFLDDTQHGIFATRYPVRPNPLGLSVVRVVDCLAGQINFLGADMLDGTPLLDIKPYIPEFDYHAVTKIGWYARRAHL
ncbi:MAG: tRNA (N6-threonylcarbamoyladenosine(37)-N6)-methyltransferase TrmO [Anaerolineaceae bacterium]|nr:tRNA (N6-threonylcarbamoyladenosine(37)-N6)-methyltransferase TrmO [Anaerolineaceae bacterium]